MTDLNDHPNRASRRLRAAIYCRISRDQSGTELGVTRQLVDCRALAEREGFDIVGEFTDDDTSAYSGKRRKDFEALKAQVKTGNVDVILAWHPDRITRHPRELEDIIDLLNATNTKVRTVQTGEYDLSTSSGRTTARIVGAVARGESEHKQARLQRKHEELAQAGAISGGGSRPFGYEICQRIQRKDEADLVRKMAADLIAGASMHSIARGLNALGVTSSTGAKFTPSKVRRILESPRIAGLRHLKRATKANADGEPLDIVAPSTQWEAIIPIEDHHRIIAILENPARVTNHGGRPKRLLTGLLFCGKCGNSMTSRPRSNGNAAYRCVKDNGGCNGNSILGDQLDMNIEEALMARPGPTEMAAALIEPVGDDAIMEEMRKIDARLIELMQLWADEKITSAERDAASESLKLRKQRWQAELREAPAARQFEDMGTVAELWPTASTEQRRKILAKYISRIEIGPSRPGLHRFDWERVAITWAR